LRKGSAGHTSGLGVHYAVGLLRRSTELGLFMPLPWKEQLTALLVPSSLYYRRRIADEAEWGEHELDVLGEIVAPGGTAIDVGANQGFFAYAFAAISQRVEAFEPNPDYAAFARRMLGSRARVHAVALSNRNGRQEFVVPVSDAGMALHLGGALADVGSAAARMMRFEVEVRTLDSYGFKDVRVVKVDVEGSEMAVLEGARATLLRDRPALIVELLTGAHADPAAVTEAISATFGYAAWLVTKDRKRVEALPVIRGLGSNTTWGSPIRNRNVLFLQR
jgi:FkbM family methyltransferase